MLRKRNTKIIATLGPSSSSPLKIHSLFQAGADIFRLNFSHGTHSDHRKRVFHIRQYEKRLGRPIAILGDLQGPKIRIGSFKNSSAFLKNNQKFELDLNPTPGDEKRVFLPHPEIYKSVKKNTRVLIDDGKLILNITKVSSDKITTEVINGGKISNMKGVNIPESFIKMSSLTKKDIKDLEFCLDLSLDYVALSFVQKAKDLIDLKKHIGNQTAIMAKFEKPLAIKRMEEILYHCDAAMVARGDLGVEMPPEEVPIIQKRIVQSCRDYGKPVVVATQMLDSMINSPSPTRAEASDVATAVFDAADSLMLSAETASGKFPVESVQIMDRIIRGVEYDSSYRQILESKKIKLEETTSDAISSAASQVVKTVLAKAIFTYTRSGATAKRAARERPTVPIIGLSPDRITARQLALIWGVHTIHALEPKSFSGMIENACELAKKEGIVKKGDYVVVTAGAPIGVSGSTNNLRIAKIN
ncbi:MAG: pyruvate kinase [Alphaproteobacteria bacterium]|tara:strand:+ start:705 stop:2120 length:1416 start_codon:yes stop_codon:yes gene_type:complete